MSDFARLEEKLAKLRQRERAPGEGRRLQGADGRARLAALVTEIDETILPRRLSFALGEGAALHLAVANRRLQAVLAPAPQGIPSGLVDHQLSDAAAPEVAELRTVLEEVLGAAGTIPISSARPKKTFASDVGIPAPQLARAWGASEAQADVVQDDVLTAFLDGIGDKATAWLRIEGEEVTGQGGASQAAEALSDLAAVFLDSYFSKFDAAFPEPSDACATLIAPGKNGSGALLFVEIGRLSAVVLAPPDRIVGMAARWQGLVAT
jgi:hypothetical protein